MTSDRLASAPPWATSSTREPWRGRPSEWLPARPHTAAGPARQVLRRLARSHPGVSRDHWLTRVVLIELMIATARPLDLGVRIWPRLEHFTLASHVGDGNAQKFGDHGGMAGRDVRGAHERWLGFLRVLEARDPSTPHDRLRDLAGDMIRPVRLWTARTDPDETVKWNVLLNRSTPPEALRVMADEEAASAPAGWFIVRHKVVHHPGTSAELRAQLLTAGSASLHQRNRAAMNLPGSLRVIEDVGRWHGRTGRRRYELADGHRNRAEQNGGARPRSQRRHTSANRAVPS